MNLSFDWNELCEQLIASNPSITEIESKNSNQNPTNHEFSTHDSIEEDPSNLFNLLIEEPKQLNHVWFDTHEHIPVEKQPIATRKQTADNDLICNQEILLSKKRRRNPKEPLKNQTKNIPKNFGKAIIAFTIKYKKITKNALHYMKAGSYKDFMDFLEQNKKQITTIADFRTLWTGNPYEHVLRSLSCLFLRKYSLHYIFNSRINNYGCHIKYRQRFLEAIKTPHDFKHIKDF